MEVNHEADLESTKKVAFAPFLRSDKHNVILQSVVNKAIEMYVVKGRPKRPY